MAKFVVTSDTFNPNASQKVGVTTCADGVSLVALIETLPVRAAGEKLTIQGDRNDGGIADTVL